ncbi:hypothetical protein RHMOL_Rhmol09G0092100 [Rhododendron molle]|uniref:Uncharacterized protein n=1 Tax=Rhododendron molle TaxID=49168 RepID=A0ACC0MBT3_RHOML|nr:hypothetical protein RHMOL_Rhmol09G0092100 [Rhododendron molle]
MLIDAIGKGKLVEKACMKHDKPILSTIENYDTNDSKFLIGGDLNKKKSDVAFTTRRGIQEAKIGSKKMKDMINEILQKKEESMTDEDIRDVVRLICMFICLTLFFSTSGVTIAWTYVHCMEKIEEIKDYDWAQSIAETLNTSMHKFHDKPRDATGCGGIDGMLNLFCYEKCFWTFFGGDQDSANRALDVVRSKILNTRTILIPIYGSNHYTLLELDTIDQEWRFYNSIRREGRREYCEAIVNLRKNVTNYINLHCKKKIKTSAKLLDNAPQQNQALVVAYVIRQKLMKTNSKRLNKATMPSNES